MKKLQPYSEEIVDDHRKVCWEIVGQRLDDVQAKFVDPRQIHYIQAIRQFINEKDGFVATADRLQDMVEYVEESIFLRSKKKKIPELYKTLNKELEEKVFSYEAWRSKAHANSVMNEFVKRVKVCPYCNTESVYTLEVIERDKTYKSAFDHFFPKSRYPFLGLSLYNLIPSCDRCNSKFKHDRCEETWNILHPYLDDVDNVSRFVLVDFEEILKGIASPGVGRAIQLRSLTGDGKPSKECEAHLKQYKALFGVDVVYSTLFQEKARETLQLGQVMNEKHLDEIKSWLAKSGLQGVDPWQLMFGTPLDRSQIDRHWLSKLKLDILEGYCGVPMPKERK